RCRSMGYAHRLDGGPRNSSDAAAPRAIKNRFRAWWLGLIVCQTGGDPDMGSNSDLHRRRGAAVPRGAANSLGVYVDHASNAELWDVEGRRYIDFASGISVLNIGHLHPRVVAAVQQQ